MTYKNAARAIRLLANPNRAAVLQRFFKTGKGEYAEGDRFLGLTVPQTRSVAKQFLGLAFPELIQLLKSPFHEERVLAGMILSFQYRRASGSKQEEIYRFYLKNRSGINNWDLVDGTAPYIVGVHLLSRNRSVLYKLVKASRVWDRRIAVVATFTFIRNRQFKDTLRLSEILLRDEHDLMHKAVGWMLREMGKRDVKTLENFLRKNAAEMPRTMLRYAIEKFPEAQRKKYLAIKRKERPRA